MSLLRQPTQVNHLQQASSFYLYIYTDGPLGRRSCNNTQRRHHLMLTLSQKDGKILAVRVLTM